MKRATSYLVAVFALSIAFMAYSNSAKADSPLQGASEAQGVMSQIKIVDGYVDVEGEETPNEGGGTVFEFTVRKENGETVTLRCCSANCPQIQPNGPACPVCAANYGTCRDAINFIAGSGQKLRFITCQGYIQGWYDDEGNVHCFDELN